MTKTQLKQKQQPILDIEEKIKEVNKKYWQKYYSEIQKVETKAEWKELALLLKQIRDLQDQIKSIESNLKSRLQTIFEQEGKEILEDEDIKVTGKWQKRSVLDVKKLKQEMPNVYEQFKTESLSFVIRIAKSKNFVARLTKTERRYKGWLIYFKKHLILWKNTTKLPKMLFGLEVKMVNMPAHGVNLLNLQTESMTMIGGLQK